MKKSEREGKPRRFKQNIFRAWKSNQGYRVSVEFTRSADVYVRIGNVYHVAGDTAREARRSRSGLLWYNGKATDQTYLSYGECQESERDQDSLKLRSLLLISGSVIRKDRLGFLEALSGKPRL